MLLIQALHVVNIVYYVNVQVQEIESELSSRKQEEAKRRRDIQEISEQVTALQLELSGLDETVDYQVSLGRSLTTDQRQ